MNRRVVLALPVLLYGCMGGFGEPLHRDGKDPKQAASRAKSGGGAAPASRASAPGAGDSGSSGGKRQQQEPEQSYAEAWTLICDAERRSGAAPELSRSERGNLVASWIVDHVKNKRARYWFIDFGKVKREEREAHFRSEARRAGRSNCALAELLFTAPAEPAAPGEREQVEQPQQPIQGGPAAGP